jgi:hypothetical protein
MVILRFSSRISLSLETATKKLSVLKVGTDTTKKPRETMEARTDKELSFFSKERSERGLTIKTQIKRPIPILETGENSKDMRESISQLLHEYGCAEGALSIVCDQCRSHQCRGCRTVKRTQSATTTGRKSIVFPPKARRHSMSSRWIDSCHSDLGLGIPRIPTRRKCIEGQDQRKKKNGSNDSLVSMNQSLDRWSNNIDNETKMDFPPPPSPSQM